MDALLTPLSEPDIKHVEALLNEWFFVVTAVFLTFELIRYVVIREFKWSLIGDTLANFLTYAGSIAIAIFLLGGFYLAAYFAASQVALFSIQTNLATVLICIVLADLAYYWEHRFLHRVNAAWATHSTHHSSPFFNISVAFRFGPLDALWPILFHIPLVMIGFNPVVVFFSEAFVLIFQTLLHTEAIKKLPRPFEWIFNTPSHHRVHHGANAKYLDANYAGMFIIWDRLFGTFVEEDEAPVYGLVEPIPEINSFPRLLASPFVAFFHGFYRVWKKVADAKSPREKRMALFGPPEWRPHARETEKTAALAE
ncbi:MAG: sterol desaturase family protein [Pseudomonadota bacterium]